MFFNFSNNAVLNLSLIPSPRIFSSKNTIPQTGDEIKNNDVNSTENVEGGLMTIYGGVIELVINLNVPICS